MRTSYGHADAESTRSTIDFHKEFRLDQSLDFEKPARRIAGSQKLLLTVNRKSFEWFDICPGLLRDITLEIFQSQISEFFCILPRNQLLRDRDGLILSTADLRRSLRVSEPCVEVSDISVQEVARTIPHPLIRRVKVRMTKSERTKRLGFSNTISSDLSRLIISEIRDPSALLEANVHVGDAIVSVNNLCDVFEMRRELREATEVVIEIEQVSALNVH